MYKPYSAGWHRHRQLKESIDQYFENSAEYDLAGDIIGILNDKMTEASSRIQMIKEVRKMLTDYGNVIH